LDAGLAEPSHLGRPPVRVVHTPGAPPELDPGASLDEIAEEAGHTTGPVYVEFWTHASRRPELRRRVAEQHEQLLDTVGGLLEEWTARWETEFTLPAREVVRGIYDLSRGMGLKALAGRSSPGTGGRGTSCWPSRASGCRP
jgi:hypothetical protein